MATWRVYQTANLDAHVLPVDDLIVHEQDDCVCGPAIEPVERPDGTIGWVVVHMSLDGRERHERAAADTVADMDTQEPR